MSSLKEIAKLTGVSYQAVSAVLNGNLSKASPATREKIFRTAAKLNYRPSRFARGLASGKSGIVGLVTQAIRSPYFADLTWELQNAAWDSGYQIIMMESDWTHEKTLDCICCLYSSPVDGIVFLGGIPEQSLRDAKIPEDYPILHIDDADTGLNSVGFDFLPGMEEAFRHLISNGLKRLALVHDPVNDAKHQAYRKCCETFQIPFREFRYVSPFFSGEEAVICCGREVARAADELDAIIVASDYDGMLIRQGLAEYDISIPLDLSVIAIDNTLLSRLCIPQLTSIVLDRKREAEIVFQRLTARIRREPDPDGHRTVATHLLIRHSVQRPHSILTGETK